MYSVLIAAGSGLLFGFGGWLLGWWGLFWAFLFAPFVTLAVWIPLARSIGKRLQPMMARLQQQLEQRMIDAARESLQGMLRYGKWMPMLEGQVYAQLGMIEYQTGDRDKAIALLRRTPRRLADAQLVLAVLQYRAGDKTAAFETLKLAGVAAKKHPMLHNAWAWLLHKEGRVDEAIAVLARFTAKVATDEAAKANLLRLQNGNKPTMKPFGLPWYALGLERPPADMGQLQQGRKGFRQPPMRRGG